MAKINQPVAVSPSGKNQKAERDMSDNLTPTGVSWLHDRLLRELKERKEHLQEGLGEGVPLQQYRQLVGRIQEIKRMIKITLPEIFQELYSADEDEDDI